VDYKRSWRVTMNVFYDGIVFYTQKYGGISRYFIELIKNFENYDDLSMFLFRFPDLFEKKENLIRKPIRYLSKIPKVRRFPTMIDSIFLPYLVNKFDSDIYHTTYYRAPENIKAFKVVTVYDLIQKKFYKDFYKSSKGADAFIERQMKCIKSADAIIAISENTKKDILEYSNVPESKIMVTYLAVSEDFRKATEDEKNAIRNKYNLNKPFIIYVGLRERYKNFITLLKAYSKWGKSQDFELVCVGGRKVFSKDEIAIIKNARIENSVRLLTGISDKEIMALYSSAHVFVYPSLYEGFGFPPLEAMNCGTPVIVANTSSIPEIVGDAGIYFDPLSEEELITCLDQITYSADLSKQLIEKGLERAKLFNWENTAKETYKIYKSLK
jgi:glycosyltransferase involved in cell wall biosynthesis